MTLSISKLVAQYSDGAVFFCDRRRSALIGKMSVTLNRPPNLCASKAQKILHEITKTLNLTLNDIWKLETTTYIRIS